MGRLARAAGRGEDVAPPVHGDGRAVHEHDPPAEYGVGQLPVCGGDFQLERVHGLGLPLADRPLALDVFVRQADHAVRPVKVRRVVPAEVPEHRPAALNEEIRIGDPDAERGAPAPGRWPDLFVHVFISLTLPPAATGCPPGRAA